MNNWHRGHVTRTGRRAKLDPQRVRAIRYLAAGGAHQTDLAADFGVHPTTIGEIVRGGLWAWVSGLTPAEGRTNSDPARSAERNDESSGLHGPGASALGLSGGA
jgi:hypothetical protein